MRSLVHRLLVVFLAALSLPALANEAAIRKAFAERMPNAPKIDEIRPSPMPGVWEVRIGNELRYTDAGANFLIEGELFDLKARKNLTEERVAQLNRIDFAGLPFKDAVVWKNGSGKRRIAVFADPNCGYCKRFEKGLQELKDVTVYTFLYPILGGDSPEKSKAIWCAKDNTKAWRDWMIKGTPVLGSPACDTSVLQRNVALGHKYKITGTPGLVFEDGRKLAGAMGNEALEKQMTSARTKSPG